VALCVFTTHYCSALCVGVATGKVSESVLKKRLDSIARAVGVPVQILAATAGDRFRKPFPGMWVRGGYLRTSYLVQCFRGQGPSPGPRSRVGWERLREFALDLAWFPSKASLFELNICAAVVWSWRAYGLCTLWEVA
jgi:polynucleotide kinase 3 phosphatase